MTSRPPGFPTSDPVRDSGRLEPTSDRAATAARVRELLPGLVLVAAGTAAALLLHAWFGRQGWLTGVGALTIAVVLGIVATNAGLRQPVLRPGTKLATAKLLRIGVVLLGLSLSLPAVLKLGPAVLAVVVATVVITFTTTRWIGSRIGVSPTQSLLVATGFAVCGASAVAGMQAAVDADEDEVAAAIAGVTVFGGACMFALPVLGPAIGLSDTQTAVWAGSSVHEVAQVVAAAGPLGAAALATAIVVKLTRVLLLAPLVAGVSLSRRRAESRAAASRQARSGLDGHGEDGLFAGDASATSARRPPVVPLFVAGFVACVALRSTGWVPDTVLDVAKWLQDLALTAALFGLGAAVDLPRLARTGARTALLGLAATLVALVVGLTGATLAVS
ncbi:MAG TPA: putative sulfate exporter family transporter [Actinomycetales bacterium]|nr:putative sulfate exporter family transporter [Actinomycetales bacterium]